MSLGPVQRECICADPLAARRGVHCDECSQAFKAKLLGRKDDVRALHAEGHHLAPECPVCAGNAVVTVPVGARDEFGNQHTEEAPCPACTAGDDEAVARVGLPAPVTAEDFNLAVIGALAAENPDADWLLDPYPSSPRSEQLRNRGSSLSGDPGRPGGGSGD